MKTNMVNIVGMFFAALILISCAPALTMDNWSPTGDMVKPRADHTATLLNNGKVLIVGWDYNSNELYDPDSRTFIEIGATKEYRRQGHTATLLNDGKVLIVGGTLAQNTAELYDPDTGDFSLTDTLEAPHSYHTATLLQDGRVLIVAGQDQNAGPQTNAIAEIYDPATGEFSLTDSLNVDRSGHGAILLPNGKVLITGGMQTTTPGNGKNITSCELYDPENGTFSMVKNLNKERGSKHQLTLLPNNLVLLTGGSWYFSIAELYDYLNDSWTTTPGMVVLRRSNHQAILLHNGLVLLAGGYFEKIVKSAELYYPKTNTFFATDSMETPRSQFAATLLQDGSVLVSGGYDDENVVLNKAELFVPDTLTSVQMDGRKLNNLNPPDFFTLSRNYPNPFNPVTRLDYTLTRAANVRIAVYNTTGELISTLVDAQHFAGSYSVTWNGKSENGSTVGTGIYLVRMESENRMLNRKVLYLK
ncbi:T9SS type A sorting domain-containing protein [candidate division KSB1 bacterium]|nr:T9SS type A sorting domain-containing protein [candidate division KSB1 bacterium]